MDTSSAEREKVMRNAALDKAARSLSIREVFRFGWRFVTIRLNRLRIRIEKKLGR